jgi:asparagine synthase (glutamine-hydrolysing)
MCGIFFLLQNSPVNYVAAFNKFMNIKWRGPDNSNFEILNYKDNNICIGFHRLSIIGVQNGSQPFNYNGIHLICNGEIFNYKQLIENHNLECYTDSDCEVIIHLYNLYGKKFIELLDGDFSFVLFDSNKGEIMFGRDIIGVRPLFYHKEDGYLNLASELKGMCKTGEQVLPGFLYSYNISSGSLHSKLYRDLSRQSYGYLNEKEVLNILKMLLINSVKKRLDSERDIGFLLSGGLDSSLVLSIACELLPNKTLHAFSIGSKNDKSPDVINAKKVVAYLNSKYYKNKIIHHIVDFDTDKALQNIENIVYTLENFDITTVRASTPMWWLCKYISEKTDIKVLFSGEGSDEILGGYLYFFYAPNKMEFEKETFKLVDDLYKYDVCRADRCVSSNGLELRVPFLDKEFVRYVLNIDGDLRRPLHHTKMEKWILREAFKGYLPENILWNQKIAFSDGAGYSWKDKIKSYCESKVKELKIKYNPDKDFSDNPEELYHRYTFNKYYPNHKGIIDALWIPNKNWIDTGSEPSARVLEIHQE